jgi:hypothetical protein
MACWNCILPDWRRIRQLSWGERSTLFQALALLPLTALAIRWIGMGRWQSLLVRCLPARHKPEAQAKELPPTPSLALQACDDRCALRVDTPGSPAARTLLDLARQTSRMVATASRRGLWQGNCLEHSLVLWWLLSRRGISCELRVGVRFEAGSLSAHAWVVCAGAVLNDHEENIQRYVPFDRPILGQEAP